MDFAIGFNNFAIIKINDFHLTLTHTQRISAGWGVELNIFNISRSRPVGIEQNDLPEVFRFPDIPENLFAVVCLFVYSFIYLSAYISILLSLLIYVIIGPLKCT